MNSGALQVSQAFIKSIKSPLFYSCGKEGNVLYYYGHFLSGHFTVVWG